MKAFKILDPWFKAPGEKFTTKTSGENTTDIIIAESMVFKGVGGASIDYLAQSRLCATPIRNP